MVHLKDDLDVEGGALLDREGLVLEALERMGSRQVNHNIGTSLHLQGKGLDDALSGIIGVANGISSGQTQRGLPAVERLVVLVCGGFELDTKFEASGGFQEKAKFAGEREERERDANSISTVGLSGMLALYV